MGKKCATLLLLFVLCTRRSDCHGNCVSVIIAKYYFPGMMIMMIDTDLIIPYPVIYQNSSGGQVKIFEYRLPDFYVMNVKIDNIGNLFDSLKRIELFNSRARFIVLIEFSQCEAVFAKISDYFVYNAIVIDQEGNVASYRPYIYENVVTANTEAIFLGDCKDFDISSLDAVDKQLPELWRNSTVLTAYVEHFPYVYLDNGKVVGENYEVLKLLMEKLQFGVSIVKAEANTDILDLLQEGGTHIVINHRTPTIRNYLQTDIAPSNLAAHFYWIVPFKGQHSDYWKIFFLNFDFMVWLMILFFFFVSSLIFHYLERKDFITAILIQHQLLFESGNLKIIKISKLSTRIMTGTLLFSYLVISSTFRSKLLESFTTFTYEYPINSIDDIIESNLSCYISEDLKNVYVSLGDVYAKYINQCEIVEEDDDQQDLLLKVAFEQNLAIVSRELKFKFALNNLLTMGHDIPLIHMISRQVKFDFLYVHFSKGYPLLDRLSKVLRRMHSAGLNSYFRQLVNYKIITALKSKETIHSHNLTIEHVSLAFYVLFVGMGGSTVVFFVELVAKWTKLF